MGFESAVGAPDEQRSQVVKKPIEGTAPPPPRKNNNADHTPYKKLPTDQTGQPVGVGGAGIRKDPFQTVGKVTPVKELPNKKPPPVEGPTDMFATWTWKTVGMAVGLVALLALVLMPGPLLALLHISK